MRDLRDAAALGRNTEGGAGKQAGQPSESLSAATDSTRYDTTADVFFRDSYAVLVRGASVRRHLYFNLPAAERAVRRANGRGDNASMTLVRLVPVRGGAQDG